MQTLQSVRNRNYASLFLWIPILGKTTTLQFNQIVETAPYLLKTNHPRWCYQNHKETRQSKHHGKQGFMINPRSCSDIERAPAQISCTPSASATGVCLCSRWSTAPLRTSEATRRCLMLPRCVVQRIQLKRLWKYSDTSQCFSLAFLGFLPHIHHMLLSFSDLISCYLPLCSNMCGWPAHVINISD